MSRISHTFPIDPMFEPPYGWLKSTLSKIKYSNRLIQMSGPVEARYFYSESQLRFQHEQWVRLAGVAATDTHFSVIVPVHNEAHSLPSFLGALLLSEIPQRADVLVIFVINASTDRSADLIKDRLSHIGAQLEVILPRSAYDKKRLAVAHQFCQSGIRFLIVETPTPGKANALSVGNEIARWEDHEIAMSIDANNWVEPDSVALLFASARKYGLALKHNDAVIVNVVEYYATRDRTDQTVPEAKVHKAEVTGWMFAWSTSWIEENEGFPQQAIEDYGTGLLALSQGRLIMESPAHVWGYAAADPSDENRQLIRYLYGAMQLARRFKNNRLAMGILLEDFPNLRPLRQRFEHHVFGTWKSRRFVSLIRGMVRWLRNEFLILKAKRKFNSDPNSQTWEPIQSTKNGALSTGNKSSSLILRPVSAFVFLTTKMLIYFENLCDLLINYWN